MKLLSFISGRVRFRSKAADSSLAVSFFVVCLALSIAGGFRHEIWDRLSDVSGDISITEPGFRGASTSFELDSALFDSIASLEQVSSLRPVVYSGVMMRKGDEMHGVVFKGVEDGESATSDKINIPRRLSELLCLTEGDKLACYFINEQCSVRNMEVGGIYDGIVTDDDKLVVFCNIDFLRRACAMGEDELSAIEVLLREDMRNASDVEIAEDAINDLLSDYNENIENDSLMATSLRSEYPQLFDWLGVIDMNMLVILALMLIVAAVNMISALLIMLFENISFIGLLKSMGMRSRQISGIFLISSAREIVKGMIWGNAAAVLLCLAQKQFNLVKLSPENYFVSSLPVRIDLLQLLSFDILSFFVILVCLVVPCRFISKVDPAVTVRTK